MNILIIKLGAIGDVLRTTALLPGLKGKYPDCPITWVTLPGSKDLLRNNELVDKLFIFENKEAVQEIFSSDYDLVISLEDDVGVLDIVSNAKYEKIIGAYLDKGKVMYTDDSSKWFDMGLTSRFGKERADRLKKENQKSFLEIWCPILGIDKGVCAPGLTLDKANDDFASDFFKKNNVSEHDTVIGISIGAGGRWPLKVFSMEKTIELINNLSESGNGKIVLFGGPNEEERNQKIIEKVSGKVVDAGCDNSLLDFSALVKRCDLLITSDSLAVHIGNAFKRKMIVLFGPTSAAEIDLFTDGAKLVPDHVDYCSYKRDSDASPRCIDVIPIEKIVGEAKRLLSS